MASKYIYNQNNFAYVSYNFLVNFVMTFVFDNFHVLTLKKQNVLYLEKYLFNIYFNS